MNTCHVNPELSLYYFGNIPAPQLPHPPPTSTAPYFVCCSLPWLLVAAAFVEYLCCRCLNPVLLCHLHTTDISNEIPIYRVFDELYCIGIRDIFATPPCLDLIALILSIRAWISYSPKKCKWKARVTVVAWRNGATPYRQTPVFDPCPGSAACIIWFTLHEESRTRSCQTHDSTKSVSFQ